MSHQAIFDFANADRAAVAQKSYVRPLGPTPSDVTENYHKGNFESQEANKAVAPKKVALREQIHQFIESCGKKGATTHEIQNALRLKHQTVSARLSEMKNPECDFPIFWNGLKRSTDGSCPARVFVTSKGQLQ